MHSGLRITFVYDIELKRGTALWVDRTIASGDGHGDGRVRHPHPALPGDAARGRPHGARPRPSSARTRPAPGSPSSRSCRSSAAPALEGNSEYLPARAGPHDAAQRLVRVAVGRWRRRARQVHVSPVGRAPAPDLPRHQPHEHYPRGDPPDAARPAARPRAPSGGRSATTRASFSSASSSSSPRSWRWCGSPTARPSSTPTS